MAGFTNWKGEYTDGAYYCQLSQPVTNLHPATRSAYPKTYQVWGRDSDEITEYLRAAGYVGGPVAIYSNTGKVGEVQP